VINNEQALLNRHTTRSGAIIAALYHMDNPLKPASHSESFFSNTLSEPALHNSAQHTERISKQSAQYDLEELSALLATLNIATLHSVLQKRIRPTTTYYLGKGKIQYIAQKAQQLNAGVIVIDGELTGPQQRNIESLTHCQVLDRSGIILEIFSQHASTHMARIQVQMAKWQYLLPKLVGAWSHFSRQAGGGVKSRGMGEKQIEIDRRIARSKIASLRKKLDHIQVEKTEQRKLRQECFKVAIVGYTNSGKTTLMQGITQAHEAGQDQLFATLSARVKSIHPSKHPQILFTDTVGFIRRLPHSLIKSFHSTLQETLDAHLCLHVIDVSHPQCAMQMNTTHEVLKDIGAQHLDIIHVFNKTDRLDDPLRKKIIQKRYPDSVWMSAFSKDDIHSISERIWDYFQKYFCAASLRVHIQNSALISMIYQHAVVLEADYEQQGSVEFKVKAKISSLKKIEKHLIKTGGSIHIITKHAHQKSSLGGAYLM